MVLVLDWEKITRKSKARVGGSGYKWSNSTLRVRESGNDSGGDGQHDLLGILTSVASMGVFAVTLASFIYSLIKGPQIAVITEKEATKLAEYIDKRLGEIRGDIKDMERKLLERIERLEERWVWEEAYSKTPPEAWPYYRPKK